MTKGDREREAGVGPGVAVAHGDDLPDAQRLEASDAERSRDLLEEPPGRRRHVALQVQHRGHPDLGPARASGHDVALGNGPERREVVPLDDFRLQRLPVDRPRRVERQRILHGEGIAAEQPEVRVHGLHR